MEVFAGGRRSGKTTRAILWLLQNWDGGVIVCCDYQRTRYTVSQASMMTGLPTKMLARKIVPAKPETVLPLAYQPNSRFLLEDLDDIPRKDQDEIFRVAKVVAYTCSR